MDLENLTKDLVVPLQNQSQKLYRNQLLNQSIPQNLRWFQLLILTTQQPAQLMMNIHLIQLTLIQTHHTAHIALLALIAQ